MAKSYLKLLLVFILLWPGCHNDDDMTGYYHTYQVEGDWELVNSINAPWSDLKYLIINPDNFYCFMLNPEGDSYEIYEGIYSVTGNQINMSQFGLFIFTVIDDTLTLTNDYSLIFIRTDTAPKETDWLFPVTILRNLH